MTGGDPRDLNYNQTIFTPNYIYTLYSTLYSMQQGWAIALFEKERIALFFAKKSEKKSERAI